MQSSQEQPEPISSLRLQREFEVILSEMYTDNLFQFCCCARGLHLGRSLITLVWGLLLYQPHAIGQGGVVYYISRTIGALPKMFWLLSESICTTAAQSLALHFHPCRYRMSARNIVDDPRQMSAAEMTPHFRLCVVVYVDFCHAARVVFPFPSLPS